MSTRRKFMQSVSAGIAGVALPWRPYAGNAAATGTRDVNRGSSWEAVRDAFPLSRQKVYFNNGTYGPSPFCVADTVHKAMCYSNETGDYGSTSETRASIAKFVNVKNEEIALTHSTTEGINIMTWGLPLKQGDEVIISNHEHVGNALPWLNRAKLQGIILRTFEPQQTAQGNCDVIERMITSRTRVIAIPHVTCTTGLVFPIREIAAFARSKGIYTAIDGAHGAGTFNLDLRQLGCDFYATCCHKWMLGPPGTGFLYVREALLDELQTYWVGANSDVGWDLQNSPPIFKGYAQSARRYDFGSQNAAIYAGVEAAICFLDQIGKERIEKRIRELSTYFLDRLLLLDGKIEVLTPIEPASRLSMVSFKIVRRNFMDFFSLANQNNFRLRAVPESGLDAIRVSTHIYNNTDELDHFIDFIKIHA